MKATASLAFLTSAGKKLGIGFFIDDIRLMTCAHVVANCFPSRERGADLRDEIIECEFLTEATDRVFIARVEVYRRALPAGTGTPEEQTNSDIAVLAITRSAGDLPLKPKPLELRAPRTGSRVVLKGAVTDKQGKVTVTTGMVVTEVEDGRYYAKVDSGQPARPGYSGGPVEDMDTNRVLGMVQKTPESGGDARFISCVTLRNALAAQLDLKVELASAGPAMTDVTLAPPAKADQEMSAHFVTGLLKAKDRDDQEKQLLEAIAEAAKNDAMAVAVLHAPEESCPDVFRSRLGDPDFAKKRQWSQPTTWGEDWPAPTFSLIGDEATTGKFGHHLEQLFETAFSPGTPTLPADPTKFRSTLIKRLALLPVTVHAQPGAWASGGRALRDELERWAKAHQSAGRPAFCVLLVVHTQIRRGMMNFGWFRRAPTSSDQEIVSALGGLPGISVRVLSPLRLLDAALDLDPWISRTSSAFRRRGLEPLVVRNRVLDKTYDSNESLKITFFQWSCRLDQHAKHIFARSTWN
jgi:hypothetical protein